MLSGAFPAETRASAQAIFASGMLVGGAAGQVLGGLIAPRYGWQAALFVIAAVGLLPVIAMMTLQEPPRGPASEACPILKLLTVPAFLAMIAGGICITFSCVSILTWGVDFALAFVLLAIQTDDRRLVLAALALASFFMSWYHGPVTAVIHDMMPRRAHATSIGVYMFVTQLVGAFGPKLVGRISDLHDMQLALQIAVAVMVAGGLPMLLVLHFIRRDGLQHSCLDSFPPAPGDSIFPPPARPFLPLPRI